MKIALVLQGGVDRSGEQRVIPVVLALLERLASRHEVHVFALAQEPRPGRWRLCGAEIHNIGVRRGVLRTVRAIAREHGIARFDLLHALWAGHGAMAATMAAKLLRRPLLVHVTGGELVSLDDIGYGQMRSWRGRLLTRWVLGNATHITATSEPIVKMAAAAGFGAQRVQLGIDLRAWPARVPARRDSARPARLIQVASLNRVKDHATTLHALSQLQAGGARFHADFVGEDTLGGEVQALAQRLGLGGVVRFHDFLTQRELRPLMEQAHLHLVSSWHEAGPAAALEAAVLGVPTVGTRVGHLSEWAPEAASVVDPGDAARMAANISALLRDEELRLRMARAAQAHALREDADHTAQAFESLYVRFSAPPRED